MTVYESCESRVANKRAALDNLPENDVLGRLEALIEIIGIQDEEMEELKKLAGTPKITVHERFGDKREVVELQLRWEGKEVWFRAKTKDGDKVDSLYLKGE